jgi:hypothetical protein
MLRRSGGLDLRTYVALALTLTISTVSLLGDAPAIQSPPLPTYIALKITAKQPSPDGTLVTFTLASGAWVKIRAIDIDYDRTAVYSQTVIVKASSVLTSADKKSVTLTFSRGFLAAVWVVDIDYDIMRSGFSAYHAAARGQGETGGSLGSSYYVIGAKCAKDWPDDFRMRAYCEEQQRAGASNLSSRTMTTSDQQTIRSKCATDWPDDFRMRDYC